MNESPEQDEWDIYNEEEQSVSDNKEPWWNDGDKVGGAFATVIMIAFVALTVALVIKTIIYLFTGSW